MNAESLTDLNARIGELDNRIAISDEIANARLTTEKEDLENRKTSLEGRGARLRNRLQESSQGGDL